MLVQKQRVAGCKQLLLLLPIIAMLLTSFVSQEAETIGDDEPQGAINSIAKVEADMPFSEVEIAPTFQGGDLNKFKGWVYERLSYPQQAIDEGISGLVEIQFVVERDGSLSSVQALNELKYLGDEAVRIVMSSPKWTPGIIKGKPIRVLYILPIVFKSISD